MRNVGNITRNLMAYKLGQANCYLKKAKKIFEDIELYNSKIEGDLYGILQFCNEKILKMQQARAKEYE